MSPALTLSAHHLSLVMTCFSLALSVVSNSFQTTLAVTTGEVATVYDTASHTPDEVRCDVVESSSHGVHGRLPFGDRAEHGSPE